jgi:hypothetical protein
MAMNRHFEIAAKSVMFSAGPDKKPDAPVDKDRIFG